ncbi:uncharacterized protein LOC111617928 isoform X2 [Centruroides sculpturatus]|uniref:uncharacterized protein LOC111617928 isoform X2 n=1 Tax=Centruroides sculpturatus TaxID=218467 RepID=UPI000C6D0CC6|nr:uncharacterized protein LOC111617928 isoform X2 [Centruroides sculpturatus]
MDSKEESFFSKLKNISKNLQNDLNELNHKLLMPKSELPEDSSIIYITHMLDDLKLLKEETTKVDDDIQQLQNIRANFKKDLETSIEDIDEQLNNLETKLQNYGYVPWKQRKHSIKIENNVKEEPVKNAIEENNKKEPKECSDPDIEEKKQKMKTTPTLPLRSLPNLYNKIDERLKNNIPTQMIIVTPKLNRGYHNINDVKMQTPSYFNDDVVITPGLFMPYSKETRKDPVPKFELKHDQSPQYHIELNQKFVGKAMERGSPFKNWEEDVTVNLFKRTNLMPQKPNIKTDNKSIPEESTVQLEYKENNESFNTPDEPILTNYDHKNVLESLRKTLRKKKNIDIDSNTPEEPLLMSEHKQTKFLEFTMSIRKKNNDNQEESSSTPEESLFSATNRFCEDGPKTPEEPKLKTLTYLQQTKRCQNLFFH